MNDPRVSRPFRLRARGPLACFTRPEMKAERVSYEVMTPSAARGLFEAILWKPAIRWQIHRIAVLAPIQWTSVRRNEVKEKQSLQQASFFADTEGRRSQRATIALRNVDYLVEATFRLTDQAAEGDTRPKFEAMFERRLVQGQHFHQPYLGCREFAADIEPAPETFQPIDPGVNRPLGLMFYDFEYGPNRGDAAERPLFFEARLNGGVLEVPDIAEVKAQNGGPA